MYKGVVKVTDKQINRTDLTNRTFGCLKVRRIYQIKKGQTDWLCDCVCGNTIAASAKLLLHGEVIDCGCLSDKRELKNIGVIYVDTKYKRKSSPKSLESGRKVAEVGGTATKAAKPKTSDTATKAAKPKKSEKTTNSTIAVQDDIIGFQFGELTVLEFLGVKNRLRLYKCRCSCGKEIEAFGTYLRRGRKTSCGHGRQRKKKKTDTTETKPTDVDTNSTANDIEDRR